MSEPARPTRTASATINRPPRPPRPPASGSTPPGGAPPPPSGGGPSNPTLIMTVIVAGLVAGLAIVYFVLPRWLMTPDAPSSTPATTSAPASGDLRRLGATLYYVGDDGASLVGVAREVAFGGTPAEQARVILAAQLAPAPDAVSAIPPGVTLRNVYLTPRGDAYVDLSHDIITGHPGGSLNEALTVYTIVNALTQNIKEITGVQILVDGKQIDTLAGHIDLRQPLAAGPRWVQKGP